MAKGQKKSNREAKKPKKTEAERLKAKTAASSAPPSVTSKIERPKKT